MSASSKPGSNAGRHTSNSARRSLLSAMTPWPRSSSLTGQWRAREGHTMRRALTAIALVALVGLATVAAGAALQPFKTLFIWEVCR